MSNRKRLPETGLQAPGHRLRGGRHRQRSRSVAGLVGVPGHVGAKVLAAGALGSAAVVALPIGAGSVASLASTGTGGSRVASLTADILPAPPMYFKAPPASGAPASVPLPVPRPADAPGPATTEPSPGPNPPASTQSAPAQDQFGAGAQPIQTYGLAPGTQSVWDALSQPATSVPVSVRAAGYLPSGVGGFVQVTTNPDTDQNALTLGFGGGVPGANVAVNLNDQSSTNFGVGVQARVGVPFSTEAFNQYGLALSGEVGLPPEAYVPPSPQQTVNDASAVFWPQTGVMQAPSPAPGAQAVPYLSIGNSGGPADPITGAPAATGTTQATGSLPSWAVPGLGSGSDGTGKQGLLDSSSGTDRPHHGVNGGDERK